MAGEQGVLELGQDGVLVAEHALEQWLAGGDLATALRRTSSLTGHGLPARFVELAEGGGADDMARTLSDRAAVEKAVPAPSADSSATGAGLRDCTAWTCPGRGAPPSPTTTCAAPPSRSTSTTASGRRSRCPATGAATPPSATSDGPLIYRCRFELDPGVPDARHWVVLDGVFSQGDVWLDGAYLGDSEGYFVRHAYDVTELARLGTEHVLAVEVTNLPPLGVARKRTIIGAFRHGDCVDPAWNPGGLWRPVRVERSGPVRIGRVRVLCTRRTHAGTAVDHGHAR